MFKMIKFTGAFVLSSISIYSFGLPCIEGERSNHALLKSCQLTSPGIDSDMKLAKVDFCLSRINKDGGPFGGDPVPWFFTNFQITAASGEVFGFSFDNPDGRHNFRSPIDYSVLDFSSGQFYLESHRTSYPANQKNGNIDLHTITFDSYSNRITFDYKKRNGVMFGKWEDKLKFEGVCTDLPRTNG